MLAYVLLARKIDASTEKLLNMLQDILVLMRSSLKVSFPPMPHRQDLSEQVALSIESGVDLSG